VSRTESSLTTQAFWFLVAKTIGFAMTTALPLVLVRTLSQSEFGVYKQAFLIVNTALSVLPLGFGMGAFYFLPRERANHQAVVLHILGVHLAVGGAAAAVLVAWPHVLVLIFGSADLVPYASLLAAVLVTWTIGSFLDIVAVARQDLVASTLFIVGSQASKTLVFVVAASAGGSIAALLTAGIVQGVLQIAVLLGYLQVRFPGFWRSFDWGMLRTQASYALPLGLSSLVFRFQNDLPQYFVANAFGPSLYAIFAVGVFNVPLVGLLRESVGSVMLPRVSRLEQEADSRAILLLVARVARKLALVYFPLYVFLLVVGHEVIVLLFTRQYASSWPVFAVYLTVIPLGVIVLDPITRAYAEQRFFLLKLRVALFAAMTVAFVFGINRLGLLGTIWVVVIVQVAGTVGAAWRLNQVMHVRRTDYQAFAVLIRIGAAAAAAGLIAAAVRHAALAWSPFAIVSTAGVAYALAYVLALGAARVVEPEDVAAIGAIFGRDRARRSSTVTGTLLAEGAER
jgi:O-antigen/teichoic acid export membrane protein